jgi:hypothetical protein
LKSNTVRALGALRSLRNKKKLALKKWQETHFWNNEEKEKWIQDYVERETAVARKRIEEAETAVQQEQDDMQYAEIARLTNWEPEKSVAEMTATIGDRLSGFGSSDDWVDGEDEDDQEIEQGKLREDDEPGWVMGTITTTVQ